MFFLDSVDEAKAVNVHLATALTRVEKEIGPALGRAHLILSSRVKPWDDQRGVELLATVAAIPQDREQLKPLSEDELLRKTRLRENKQEKKTPPEEPRVLKLVALDRDRVRLYAIAKKVSEPDKFLEAIDGRDLWSLVDRPLDLNWYGEYWNKNKKLGTYAQMMAYSVGKRLKEPNPERADGDLLEPEQANALADRIGAAMVLAKQDKLFLPEPNDLSAAPADSLAFFDILSDVPTSSQIQLSDRPLFGPASINQIRLHSDNEGKLRTFLAARWMKGQLDNHCPKKRFMICFSSRHMAVRLFDQRCKKLQFGYQCGSLMWGRAF